MPQRERDQYNTSGEKNGASGEDGEREIGRGHKNRLSVFQAEERRGNGGMKTILNYNMRIHIFLRKSCVLLFTLTSVRNPECKQNRHYFYTLKKRTCYGNNILYNILFRHLNACLLQSNVLCEYMNVLYECIID